MPKIYLLWATIALLAGCANNDTDQETLEELRSIRKEVAFLSDSIATLKDSLTSVPVPPVDTLAVQVSEPEPVPKPSPPVEPTKPAPPKPLQNPRQRTKIRSPPTTNT